MSLMPLLGIHYFLTIIIEQCGDHFLATIPGKMVQLIEVLIGSTQGFLVAVLYGLASREVKHEIRTKWEKMWTEVKLTKDAKRRNSTHKLLPINANGNNGAGAGGQIENSYQKYTTFFTNRNNNYSANSNQQATQRDSRVSVGSQGPRRGSVPTESILTSEMSLRPTNTSSSAMESYRSSSSVMAMGHRKSCGSRLTFTRMDSKTNAAQFNLKEKALPTLEASSENNNNNSQKQHPQLGTRISNDTVTTILGKNLNNARDETSGPLLEKMDNETHVDDAKIN